jgi:GxxExxY protein
MHEPIPYRTEASGRNVVNAAMAVHKTLGPGPLESTYEVCLAHELEQRGQRVQRQVTLPVVYGTVRLEAGYRIDLVVENSVIVEVKSVEALAPVHEAQLLTYLRLSERRLGFFDPATPPPQPCQAAAAGTH